MDNVHYETQLRKDTQREVEELFSIFRYFKMTFISVMPKLHFQSSVSQDPSEIILICCVKLRCGEAPKKLSTPTVVCPV